MRMSPGTINAGKHLMPRLNAAEFASDPQYRQRIFSYVRELGVAGFCVFGGGEDEVIAAVNAARSAASRDIIFSADCEFGLPMRFSCGTEFPDAMAIARTGEPELGLKVGAAIAKEMRALGLSWNFAPVADVNSNPDNPIINTRAFGDDQYVVSKYAVEYMRGLQSQGIIATAKHFPGHGDTSVDSHRALPYLDGDLERFERLELAPFKALIDVGVDSIMTGHLATPALIQELGANEALDLPATLSRTITTKLLRERMAFRGLIVTDAMEMKAIRNTYGDAEATRMAFEAGADIVLMPPDVEVAFEAIASDRKRPDVWIATRAPIEPHGNLCDLGREHSELALEVARKSIEIKGTVDLHDRDLLLLTDHRPEVDSKATLFIERVKSIFRSIRRVSAGGDLEVSRDAILAVFHRARGYIDADATEWTIPRIMKGIAERGSTLGGLILFGNPYLDRHFATSPGFVLKTFSESTPSIVSASEKLLEVYRSQ